MDEGRKDDLTQGELSHAMQGMGMSKADADSYAKGIIERSGAGIARQLTDILKAQAPRTAPSADEPVKGYLTGKEREAAILSEKLLDEIQDRFLKGGIPFEIAIDNMTSMGCALFGAGLAFNPPNAIAALNGVIRKTIQAKDMTTAEMEAETVVLRTEALGEEEA